MTGEDGIERGKPARWPVIYKPEDPKILATLGWHRDQYESLFFVIGDREPRDVMLATFVAGDPTAVSIFLRKSLIADLLSRGEVDAGAFYDEFYEGEIYKAIREVNPTLFSSLIADAINDVSDLSIGETPEPRELY